MPPSGTLLLLAEEEEQQLRQHIETIVHAQAVGLSPGSGDSSQNVAGVSSTEPRATAWTLCICLYHPSCLGPRPPTFGPYHFLVPSVVGIRILTVYLREPTCEPEPSPLLSTGYLLLLSTAHIL